MAREYAEIPVAPETRTRLRVEKARHDETYDEAVNRLLDEVSGGTERRGAVEA